ncbi:polyprenyl synthetase family protein [Saccharopolyspora taberi]|uniref:Family 2 encapsulin nanocompartment cargo protein polyprenyl transferase n=1 Tax=Saccharopolyspora taberi TaxID=60895 RepID=A0ABN3VA63_9PSEU
MTITQPGPRAADEVLADCRPLVEPALRAAVGTLPASTRRVAGYHLGWWGRDGDPGGAGPSGKAIRSALVLASAQATREASAQAAVPGAVAVELVHNSSLLHDDVIDNDTTRRHRPTAWTVFGAGEAILAGNALQVLACDVLAGAASAQVVPALRMLGDAVQQLLDGQCADLDLERRSDASLSACEAMACGKTGALMGCACALGCLLAGGTAEQVEHFRRFGQHLGLAFQHTDDLLGIWGSPEVTGKPVYSDLRNRKKSLPVVYAMTSGTPAGRELVALFQHSGPDGQRDLARAGALVEQAGGRRWSRAQADTQLARALRHLKAAAPRGEAETELVAMAELVVRRDH